MLLYACWNADLEHLRGSNDTEGVCNFGHSMPEFYSACRSVAFGWAVGGSVRSDRIVSVCCVISFNVAELLSFFVMVDVIKAIYFAMRSQMRR